MPPRFHRWTFLLVVGVTASLASAAPQETRRPSRVTFIESGDFTTLVSRLAEKFSTEIPVDERVAKKDVRVDVRNGGYYEILDALCRAHGEASYFLPQRLGYYEEGTTVRAGPWVEYPTAYHGDFKLILSHTLHTRQQSVEGSDSWTHVGLVAFAPPWMTLCRIANFHHKWTISEATDADGKDLRPKDDWTASRLHIVPYSHLFGNRTDETGRLRHFDPARGLRSLAGNVVLRPMDITPVRIPLEVEGSGEAGGMRVTVSTIKEEDRDAGFASWIIKLRVDRKSEDAVPALDHRQLFEVAGRFEGDPQGWRYVRGLQTRDPSPTIATPRFASLPDWVELRVRGKMRDIEIPFRFQNVVFRDSP